MKYANTFKDLICWQRSSELVDAVYSTTDKLQDLNLKDQLRRAAVSAMSNIAEGFGRNSKREFCRFLEIATSSCLEVDTLTLKINIEGNLTPQEIDKILSLSRETYNTASSLSRTIKNKLKQIELGKK